MKWSIASDAVKVSKVSANSPKMEAVTVPVVSVKSMAKRHLYILTKGKRKKYMHMRKNEQEGILVSKSRRD